MLSNYSTALEIFLIKNLEMMGTLRGEDDSLVLRPLIVATNLLDKSLGHMLPGEGDEGEAAGLIVLHLVYRPDNLDHLAKLGEVGLKVLLVHGLPRRQLAYVDRVLPSFGLLKQFYIIFFYFMLDYPNVPIVMMPLGHITCE